MFTVIEKIEMLFNSSTNPHLSETFLKNFIIMITFFILIMYLQEALDQQHLNLCLDNRFFIFQKIVSFPSV